MNSSTKLPAFIGTLCPKCGGRIATGQWLEVDDKGRVVHVECKAAT